MDEDCKHTYTQQVISYVHEALRKGTLRPGDSVTEQMLSLALGASRAPIREALQILTNEGLIRSYPYRGRSIRIMSHEEIMDNAFIVGAIEGALAVRALPYHKDEDMDRLGSLVADMETAAKVGRAIAEMECLTDEFHRLICGYRHLSDFTLHTRRNCRNVSRILYYKYWKNIFTLDQRAARHRFLLDAVKTGDIIYIDAVVRRHQMEVGEGICRLMNRNEKMLDENSSRIESLILTSGFSGEHGCA